MTMNINSIKIASRSSPLALAQVAEVHALLHSEGHHIHFDQATYTTQGDKDKKTFLTDPCPDDFFTDTIDAAVLNGEVHVAIHSAKDLPSKLREGLSVFALTPTLDSTDAFVGNVHFKELKAGAKIGTSSALRHKYIQAQNQEFHTVNIRGTIEERLELIEKGACDGIIVATAALKRLGLAGLIKDIMPWETTPLQGQLAIVGRGSDSALKALFSRIDVRRTYGSVWLVGAGPGDPDLITLKGMKALKQAECIFYDYLTHKDLLSYSDHAEKIYVGKRKGSHTLPQAELSKLIKEKAFAGRNIVRLKGGDPLIFGRGAEEIEYLRSHHIDVQVIPGVSSATAIPSSLGVPLTARNLSSSVAFISGHDKEERSGDPQPIHIPTVDTIVFLMGLTKLDIILKSLTEAGWNPETPMLIISRGTCADEKVISGNLKTIAQKVQDEKPEQPALIVAGQTVNFWNPQAHQNGRILYTGTNPEYFKPLGPIVHLPMIHVEKAQIDPVIIEPLIRHLDHYAMILFTSRFAIEYFFQILEDHGCASSRLRDKDFLVIGKNTAYALDRYRIKPALIAQVETSQGLLDAVVKKFDVRNKKILFPRSSLPNPFLKTELAKRGAQVNELVVYQNTKLPKRDLPTFGINRVLFTSPSTVTNFLEDYETIPHHWKILSKGPVTCQKLKEAGYDASEVVIYD